MSSSRRRPARRRPSKDGNRKQMQQLLGYAVQALGIAIGYVVARALGL